MSTRLQGRRIKWGGNISAIIGPSQAGKGGCGDASDKRTTKATPSTSKKRGRGDDRKRASVGKPPSIDCSWSDNVELTPEIFKDDSLTVGGVKWQLKRVVTEHKNHTPSPSKSRSFPCIGRTC